MEALWQRTRSVLTGHGLSFAVTRSRIEVDADVGPIPASALESVRAAAKQAADSLPAIPHFGEMNLTPLELLLPLPVSKTTGAVLFRSSTPGRLRLLIDGRVRIEEPESGAIEYLPPDDRFVECVLECDEAGEFVPVVRSRLRRLDPIEWAALGCAAEPLDAYGSLALWNELLQLVWPGASRSVPDREQLATAFHILKDAFEEMSSATGPLLARRDAYWDTMEAIRIRLAER
jgi:hypothetical protein